MNTLLLLSAFSRAHAHGAVDEHIAVRLEGARAQVSVGLPVDSIAFADDNGDGLLSAGEVQAHRPALLAAADDGIRLRDGDGQRPERTLTDVVVSPDAPAAQVQLVLRASWPSVPDTVFVQFSLFGPEHDTFPLLISDADTGARLQGSLTRAVPQAQIRGTARGAGAPLWLAGLVALGLVVGVFRAVATR